MSVEAREAECEYIVSAAIRFERAIYKGDGGHEEIRETYALARGEEGFWTSRQRFVGRKKGYNIAEGNGQLVRKTSSEKTKTLRSAHFLSWDVVNRRREEQD